MHRQKIEILTLRLSLRKLKLSRARQCPSVHPVSVVEGSQAWRWEAWEPRDSTYNMHLRKSQPENHRHVVEYAFNLLPGRKSERLPCHPCSAWQAPCERAVHLIYPSAPLSFSATSSATAVSFTIEFVQLQWVSLFQKQLCTDFHRSQLHPDDCSWWGSQFHSAWSQIWSSTLPRWWSPVWPLPPNLINCSHVFLDSCQSLIQLWIHGIKDKTGFKLHQKIIWHH